MNIPFLDLTPAYLELKADIDVAVLRALASGWYIGGEECNKFETTFASYCGAQYCVGVGNGLDALHLAIRALDIGAGDEVIVASNSYIATVLAITMAGATPVFVEPDPRTSNLDPVRLQDAVTSKTRAVIPTHLYGQPFDIDPIAQVCARFGLRLIEDAAQAHGARYRGQRLGSHSDIICWSFYPSKNLGAAGDGGAITTNDAELAKRIRILGNYGSRERYVNDVQGINSRLDPLHAAVLAAKLPYLDEWNARRAQIAGIYLTGLADYPVQLPHVPEWADPAWHLFVIHTPRRDEIRTALAEQGIATQLHYPIPPHLQQAYANLGLGEGSFPIAERLARETLSLPIGPHLALDDARRVVEAIRACVA